jgi:serine/threonine-protein kinase
VGQVLGTPGYMAPEQARGEVEKLDERCDVFGLGALLCVILTGQPPYRGARAEVLKRAQQADQADARARLDNCGADAELVCLAKTCLVPQREDRPRNAVAVAEQVTAYLVGVQERLRQAEVERAAAQAREEEAHARAEAEEQARRAERRARQRTLTLAATILVFVLLAGSGWLWVEHDRQTRRDETIQAVNLALGKAEQLRQQADQTPSETPAAAEQALALWQQARAALEQAEAALAAREADATTRQRVAALRAAVETGAGRAETTLAEAQREVRLLADLDEARLARSQATPQGPYVNAAASAAAYERAFTRFGLEVLRLPEAEAAQRVRGLRPELRTAVVLALDDWVFCIDDRKVRERLLQVASGADDDAWRRDFRKATDRQQLEVLTAEALSGELPADFWVHIALGGLLAKRGKQVPAAVLEERVGHLRAAVAARPQSDPAHNNLGVALKDKGDLAGAIAAYRQALKLDPKDPLAHTNLGNALAKQGDVKGAIACFKKALALDPKLVQAHGALGRALLDQGVFHEARDATRKALDVLPPGDPLRPLATQQLQECQRLLDLDTRLPALLAGDQPRDTAEQLALADFCQRYKQRYAAAVRFYAAAFAGHLTLPAPLQALHRYNAACAAVLAAAGQGEGADKLDAKEKSRLRQQALAWLRDNLQQYVKQLEDADAKSRQAVQQTLLHWQKDAALESVRGAKTLAQLPEAERAAWQQLWADVEKLLADLSQMDAPWGLTYASDS